jgi:hypothetical protein
VGLGRILLHSVLFFRPVALFSTHLTKYTARSTRLKRPALKTVRSQQHVAGPTPARITNPPGIVGVALVPGLRGKQELAARGRQSVEWQRVPGHDHAHADAPRLQVRCRAAPQRAGRFPPDSARAALQSACVFVALSPGAGPAPSAPPPTDVTAPLLRVAHLRA